MNRNLALWIGFLGGPLIWLCSFEARFALAPWACTFQSKLALFLVAIMALALCAGCAALAWEQWRTVGEQGPSDESGVVARSRFMAISGIAISSGCGLIVVAQMVPEIVLRACE